MREIKFRAWDKKTETMNDVWAIHFKGWHDSEINFIEINGLGTDGTEERSEVEVELMQYTGLTDINGKEIYEGDIVRQYKDWGNNDLDQIAEVTCDGTEWYWGEYGCISAALSIHKDTEVIGNIYENPELLEK